MATRVARKKKSAKRSPFPKCDHCTKDSVYMRRNRKTQEPERYCSIHWKKLVEAKHPERYVDKPQPKKKTAKKRAVRRRK